MRDAAALPRYQDADASSAIVVRREQYFPGNSEMARRMRELDWSKTPLGPVERWPPSLRTSVSICLDCAFPIIIWWGRELVIFYNDEYRTIWALPSIPARSGPGAQVWAEIWDVIAPMLSKSSNAASQPGPVIFSCISIEAISRKRTFPSPTAPFTKKAGGSAVSSALLSRRRRKSSASVAFGRFETLLRNAKDCCRTIGLSSRCQGASFKSPRYTFCDAV